MGTESKAGNLPLCFFAFFLFSFSFTGVAFKYSAGGFRFSAEAKQNKKTPQICENDGILIRAEVDEDLGFFLVIGLGAVEIE